VNDAGGWKPLGKPARPQTDPTGAPVGTEGGTFAVSPFVRLSRVHGLSAAGDAMIAVALAGSLFFSIDPSAARWRVGLYLALTIAPFALVSPLIGPAIDRARGGRRLMMILMNGARAVVAVLMIGNLDSLFLFPLAFAILVLQKGYAISKAAIVPTTVKTHNELVEKNARLALLSGVAGFVGAALAAIAQLLGGPGWSVAFAALAFTAAAVAATGMPKVAVASAPEGEQEREELRSGGIVLAASGMGVLRGVMGFFTFLIAFAYRGGTDDLNLSADGSALGATLHERLLDSDLGAGGTSPLVLGAVVAFTVIGSLSGSLLAPPLRERFSEERVLLGSLLVVSVCSFMGVWSGGLPGALLVGFAVGLGVNAGKLCFDTIVQRDAPDANYGRTFARFETRFQLFWVIGAIVPVAFTIPARLGFSVISIASGFAAFSYFVSARGGNMSSKLRQARGRATAPRQPVQEPSQANASTGLQDGPPMDPTAHMPTPASAEVTKVTNPSPPGEDTLF